MTPDQLLELNGRLMERAAELRRSSVYQDAPKMLAESVLIIEAFAGKIASDPKRGKKDQAYIDLKRVASSCLHAFNYMNDVAYLFAENKNVHLENRLLRERLHMAESKLIVYEMIEHAISSGTIDQITEVIKTKLKQGL